MPINEAAIRVHDEIVKAKLVAAKPRIVAQNRALVTSMLEYAKPIVVTGTPLGPAHFGYHGRDTVRVEVHSKGKRTIGQLRAAVQLAWRERGTAKGEKARWLARRAVSATRRFIGFYYGGMANWWRL